MTDLARMDDDDEPVRTWDRSPADTPKSFEAFILYRDQGPGRTLQQVGTELTKSRQLIDRWAKLHHWQSRVADYDRDQDRLWQVEVAAERHKVARKHAKFARVMQLPAIQHFQGLLGEDLTTGEALALLNASVRIEQDVYGLRTEETAPAGNVTIVVDSRVISPPTAVPDIIRYVEEDQDG